jgi:hypothetical protein
MNFEDDAFKQQACCFRRSGMEIGSGNVEEAQRTRHLLWADTSGL